MIDTVEVENPNPSDSVQHEPPDYENKPEGTFKHIVNVVFLSILFIFILLLSSEWACGM
jgi:hypothetical protein